MTISCFRSKKLSYSLPKFVAAALSASLLLSPVATASQNPSLWFNHTDIQMPANTMVAELNNGMRFVILPTTRSSNEVSIRLRIATDNADQPALASQTAQQSVNDTNWQAATQAQQTLFSLDLADADSKTLESNLAQLSQAVINNSDDNAFKHDYYIPQNATIVVTGGINTRQTIKLIQRQFSDWKKGTLTAGKSQPQLDRYLANNNKDSDYSLSSLVTLQDNQDSKLYRKEVLLSTIANKMLEHRIQQALEQQHSQAKVGVESEILFDHKLLSQIRVRDISVDEKTQTQQLVQAEIERAIATGFKQTEYEMVVSQLRNQLQKQTRRGSDNYAAEQADRFISAINHGQVYTDPSYDLDLLNFHVAHVNEFDVSKAFLDIWSTQNAVAL